MFPATLLSLLHTHTYAHTLNHLHLRKTHNLQIEITHRIAWRRSAGSYFFCDQAIINARTLLGYGDLTCQSGCSGTVGTMQYYCTDFSVAEDSSAGERSYTYNAAGLTSFEAS